MRPRPHLLAAGVVAATESGILLVRDGGAWSLPKGTPEPGEPLAQAAEREAREETGLTVAIGHAAFVTEFRSDRWGAYLQVYYEAKLVGRTPAVPTGTDPDVDAVRFVPEGDLDLHLRFRPWLVPLKEWLRDRRLRMHFFDLDREQPEV